MPLSYPAVLLLDGIVVFAAAVVALATGDGTSLVVLAAALLAHLACTISLSSCALCLLAVLRS
jgi:hypothetical protein